jgi:hypothetical protein
MGRFLHQNYSGYLVPTNADIPHVDVIFAGEFESYRIDTLKLR